jgi:excisionase family DNA binding protein
VRTRPQPRHTSDVDDDRGGGKDDTVPRERLLVTIPEAADALAVGRTTIYQLIWTGQLTPIHIGRSVRLAVEQLEEFVEGRLTIQDGPC